jgi:hypothetical protein
MFARITRRLPLSDLNLRDVRIEPRGRGIEVLDFLICDLRDMHRDLEHDGKTSVNRAQCVERNMLQLLDALSPEIHSAIAQFERYRAAPKIGDAG